MRTLSSGRASSGSARTSASEWFETRGRTARVGIVIAGLTSDSRARDDHKGRAYLKAAAQLRGAPDRGGWHAAFVGKGLTFDAGGLNLKPRPGIAKMKFDMGGGAAVPGAIERLALRKASVNIVAIVPMC
ncbi:MAG: hypothetical protein EOP63_01145 [Sphingomonadales bacterium]|nr:MAG: hypothetical protein EOP63_01145 [Sphingomonadales bacterium]